MDFFVVFGPRKTCWVASQVRFGPKRTRQGLASMSVSDPKPSLTMR